MHRRSIEPLRLGAAGRIQLCIDLGLPLNLSSVSMTR